ncbi:MAG: hypothetical protein EPN69_16290 [Rhodanobacter sp.]|nr:MAG: hypothetical protein EPN69_16290 [Rhodanobacter sp.]TAL99391.1 MAG: hypothetical protein EPN71_07665 [Rhodanobacter sp.]TAM40271.1 MAG: hypothetical protein EPN58_10915 [Rhodanobacter sp.]
MVRPTLNAIQYIEELNRLLRLDPSYRENMAFVPYPNGTTGRNVGGYAVTGPFDLLGVYARIAHQVAQAFDFSD